MTTYYERPSLRCADRFAYSVLFLTQAGFAFVAIVIGMFSAGEPLFVQYILGYGSVALFGLALLQFGMALIGERCQGALITSTTLTVLVGAVFLGIGL